MKKFLLLSILCFIPLFIVQAEDTICTQWFKYITATDTTQKENYFDQLPPDFQKTLRLELFLRNDIGIPDSTIKKTLNISDEEMNIKNLEGKNATILEHKLFQSCKDLVSANSEDIKLKKRLLDKIYLTLDQALSDYKEIESRARMPFVHDGNILPGPKNGENGSDYVEQQFIPKFVNGSLMFLISLSILMVIIGGLMFLFSSGDSDLVSRAKTTIIWSIVGVVLTILAYAIVQFIIGIDFSL